MCEKVTFLATVWNNPMGGLTSDLRLERHYWVQIEADPLVAVELG